MQVRISSLVPSGLSTITTHAWQMPCLAAEPRTGEARVFVQELDHHQPFRHLHRADGLPLILIDSGFDWNRTSGRSTAAGAEAGRGRGRCRCAEAALGAEAPVAAVLALAAEAAVWAVVMRAPPESLRVTGRSVKRWPIARDAVHDRADDGNHHHFGDALRRIGLDSGGSTSPVCVPHSDIGRAAAGNG